MKKENNLQKILDYLNNNYSGYQVPIEEQLKTIDDLIRNVDREMNSTESAFLCVGLLFKYRFNSDLHLKIQNELHELNLDYNIPYGYYDNMDSIQEIRTIIVIWLYLPGLLNYIPDRLNEDSGSNLI